MVADAIVRRGRETGTRFSCGPKSLQASIASAIEKHGILTRRGRIPFFDPSPTREVKCARKSGSRSRSLVCLALRLKSRVIEAAAVAVRDGSLAKLILAHCGASTCAIGVAVDRGKGCVCNNALVVYLGNCGLPLRWIGGRDACATKPASGSVAVDRGKGCVCNRSCPLRTTQPLTVAVDRGKGCVCNPTVRAMDTASTVVATDRGKGCVCNMTEAWPVGTQRLLRWIGGRDACATKGMLNDRNRNKKLSGSGEGMRVQRGDPMRRLLVFWVATDRGKGCVCNGIW
jgi:hypothetical protein